MPWALVPQPEFWNSFRWASTLPYIAQFGTVRLVIFIGFFHRKLRVIHNMSSSDDVTKLAMWTRCERLEQLVNKLQICPGSIHNPKGQLQQSNVVKVSNKCCSKAVPKTTKCPNVIVEGTKCDSWRDQISFQTISSQWMQKKPPNKLKRCWNGSKDTDGRGYWDTCAAPKALRLTCSLQVDVFVLAALQGAARTFLLHPQGLQWIHAFACYLNDKCEKCPSEICSDCYPFAGAMHGHEWTAKSFRLLLANVEQGLRLHPFSTTAAAQCFNCRNPLRFLETKVAFG